MIWTTLFIGIVVYLLFRYDPCFDWTSDGKLLLWYNGKEGIREYIIIYEKDNLN